MISHATECSSLFEPPQQQSLNALPRGNESKLLPTFRGAVLDSRQMLALQAPGFYESMHATPASC